MENNLYTMPALVDLHVHFREPGFEYKETIASGCAAAAAAGYSDVFTMPNLHPVTDSIEAVQDIIARADKNDSGVKVHPYAAITRGQQGTELVDLEALAPYVTGFSDDGHGVQDDNLMLEAMQRCRRLDRVIVAHCEVNSLLNGGYIHDGVYARTHHHRGICSASEWRQVERDIRLVRQTGCRYHVCHISTRESALLIRQAKAEGLPVTCETAPHYLLLSDKDLREDGCWKMNPPLRDETDRLALIEAVQDGTIDCIATDHAPHAAEEKNKGLENSAFGIVGLETAFPLMYTYLVETGIIPMQRLIDLMALNPRRIMRLGEPERTVQADLTTEYVINPAHFLSKGKATPFNGWKVKGKIVRIEKGDYPNLNK